MAEAELGEFISQAVLSLVNGERDEDIVARMTGGIGAESAERVVEQAREKIAVAADTNRVQMIGVNRLRLEKAYAEAMKNGRESAAVSAVRELNRLQDLYPRDADGDDPGHEGEVAEMLQAVGAHLRPLGLIDDDQPVVEHARAASEFIIRARADAGSHE